MIHKAELDDLGFFLSLAEAYLTETAALGGDVIACPENLDIYREAFEAYVSGRCDGVALLCDEGFTMAGFHPPGLRTRFGRTALSWGTYVAPTFRRHGLSRRLRARLDEELRALGFDSILGGYHAGNAAAEGSLRGIGFEIFQTLGVKRLDGGAS